MFHAKLESQFLSHKITNSHYLKGKTIGHKWNLQKLTVCSAVRGGKNGPCEAGALIAVVNDYVFVDKIYSRDASGMGQAGTFWSFRPGTP